jgi:SAM-dependent methyltransferase
VRRTACGGCGAGPDRLAEVLSIGMTPLADRFPATAEEAEVTYPLAAWVCLSCWLMQTSEIVPDDELYGADYGFFAGTSPSLTEANKTLAFRLMQRHPEARRVLEVACNDGDLMAHFQNVGREVLGVDPAAGPVQVARDRGLFVVKDHFGVKVATEIHEAQGPVDLIVARNVVAHVADLDDFFGGLQAVLAKGGVLVLEFQYVGDLLAGTQLDHIYHEHRSFFSVSGLADIAIRYGFNLEHAEHVDAQGGSIRAEFRLDPLGSRVAYHRWTHLEEMVGLRSWFSYEAFAARAFYARERINDLLSADLVDVGLGGLGATAKSCTLLHWLELGPELLEFIEDPAPAKIGRFTPGSKIPIVAPGEIGRPPVMLLLAWNYLPGVLKRERSWMDGGGRLLVPLPLPVLL